VVETQQPWQIRVRDPLSEVTRAERKTLLGISAIAIVIARSGFVPSKISALGINFDRADQRALLSALSLIVLYFIVAFAIYATSDLVAWRVAYHHALQERAAELVKLSTEDKVRKFNVQQQAPLTGRTWSRASRHMSVVRAFFEFAVPLVVGLFAIVFLALARLPASARDVNRASQASQNAIEGRAK
jgi:hypothetical protein